ncbi:tryptophan--tRNA ligase, partial [Burkholderia cenocepacia]|uniref:tryptophan--tRNA ligase n=1 Tax=Burkholderia cenocepacia TaxID=95486 RepID=UPI00406CA63B
VDWHALTTHYETPEVIEKNVWDVLIDWLASGIDPAQATLFIQSKVPEHAELALLLGMSTPLGWLERVPTYKEQIEKLKDKDLSTYGFLGYPVLMAADILMFNAHKVPVGRDQIQHVEMARDIAQRFNHLFGNGREFFTLPEAVIEESVATLPGLDGRKMSKSYDNTIPLFGSAKELKAAIARIVTDSRLPGEPKDPDNSHLFTLYQAFAT